MSFDQGGSDVDRGVQVLHADKLAEGYIFGEGLRADRDRVVLSDMMGGQVLAVNPQTGTVECLTKEIPRPHGTLIQPDGSVLVSSMLDNRLYRVSPENNVSIHADLSSVATGHITDMTDDGAGNIYIDDIGTRLLDGESPGAGKVIRLSAGGDCDVVADGLAFPNGIVFDPQSQSLFLVQSFSHDITRFKVQPDGALVRREIIYVLPDKKLLDGMALDDDGGLWPCLVENDHVLRVDRSGKVTHKVVLPDHEPVACAIGGKDKNFLYITAIESLNGEDVFERVGNSQVASSIWGVRIPFVKQIARP